jgi:hypothetical protein
MPDEAKAGLAERAAANVARERAEERKDVTTESLMRGGRAEAHIAIKKIPNC